MWHRRPGPPPHASALSRDPVLGVLGGLALAVAIAYGWPRGVPVAVAPVHWGLMFALHVTLAGLSLAIVRLPVTTGPVRRVWIAFTVAGTCYAAGDAAQFALLGPGLDPEMALFGSPVQSLLVLAGSAPVIAGLLTTPTGWHAPERRRQYWLDVLVVMVSAGSFGGYSFVPGADSPAAVVLALLTGPAMFMLGVFAIVRAALAAVPPLTRAAGITVSAAAGIEGLVQSLGSFADPGQSSWIIGVTLIASVLLTAGARIQYRQTRHLPGPRTMAHAEVSEPAPERFGSLPYVTVAATNMLLVAVLAGRHLDRAAWIVVIGATVNTSLVATRQVLAFAHNRRLVAALDATVARLSETMRERDELTAQLHHKAFHDTLTGLPNRAQFTDRLHLLGDGPFPALGAVLLVDLDDFKPVNDTHGHRIGDLVLTQAAERMRQCLPPGALAARIGGDEFGIIMPATEEAPDRDACGLAERLLASLTRPFTPPTGTVSISASIGVALPRPGVHAEDLLAEADRAMYAAKHTGKGTYRLGRTRDPGRLHAHDLRTGWENLRDAR